MRGIAVLGATGSIGTQALDIIRKRPERFRACVLAAGSNASKLFALAREFQPDAAALACEPVDIPDDLKHIQWYFGPDAPTRAVQAVAPDDALCAVVGIAGLSSVLSALQCCKRVLLANKEALVTGGHLVTALARQKNVPLLPVDSEHSAIFQCLQGAGGNRPERLILTASGGPFRTWPKEQIDRATKAQALGHPTWKMGAKITVDCASMMNKGLEIIEAHHLFDMPLHKIDVVVHPQSVIHSMVEYEDGAVLAQLGAPDMRTAIGYAMGYPERVPYGGERLDFARLSTLTFEAPDLGRFPCLKLAVQAQSAGGSAPTILNGANEAAVAAFLRGDIAFGEIARLVERALNKIAPFPVKTPEDVYEADEKARALVRAALK